MLKTHSKRSQNSTRGLTLIVLAGLLMVFSNLSWAKSVSVETERQTVEFGDIVTLKVSADFQVNANSLDLQSLEDQFEVLGTQRSNNIQLVNGDFKSSTNWIVQLLPKKEGQLTIPSFELEGVKSQPYTLNVTPIQVQHSGTALLPFFLEATVDQENPYIQQQVVYTLRFYHQGRYVDGMIRPPKFDKMLLEPLKEQSVYQKQIQGRNYTVYEWVYALYPQSSGEIKIDPPLFNGRIQYAGQLRSIKEFAKGIVLNVQPEPALFAEKATNSWLPAKSLSLAEDWTLPVGNTIKVGDTLTQTVTMNVQNVTASQLPNLKLLPQTNYKVYPEKPQSKEQATVSGINSVKQFKRSIVPTQAGTLTLPEQVIYWWNTDTNQLDKTVLPAKTFEINVAIIEQQNLVDCTLPSQGLTATPQGGITTETNNGFSIWTGLTALFTVLWLATSVLWLKQRRQTTSIATTETLNPAQSAPVKTQQAWSDIDSLCKLPIKALYPALKKWLKTEHQIQHFSELNNPTLQNLIQQLEASLYNESPLDNDLIKRLALALKQLDESKQTGLLKPNQQGASKLSELYER